MGVVQLCYHHDLVYGSTGICIYNYSGSLNFSLKHYMYAKSVKVGAVCWLVFKKIEFINVIIIMNITTLLGYRVVIIWCVKHHYKQLP